MRRWRRLGATISVSSILHRCSSVNGADKRYEAWYGELKNSWEDYYDYDPEEKAEEMLEDEKLELGDESFVRYYENFGGTGNPNFGISFRERNVIREVLVLGDVDNLTEKTVELTKILENRLEEA